VLQAWRFEGGCVSPEALDPDAALAGLRSPGPGVVWIDVVEPTVDDLHRVDAAVGLGEFLLEDLREGAADAGQRTKLQQHGDLFHVAVRDCSVVGGRRMIQREIDLVFGTGWLVSVRHAADRGSVADAQGDTDPDPFPVEEVSRRLTAQCSHERRVDEGFVLWAFVDLVTDRYLAITDAIDDRLDEAEALLLDDGEDGGLRSPRSSSPRDLFDTGRMLTNFRHQVIPLREVVGALLRREDPGIGDPAILHFRDVYDHLLGISELVESQRDVLAGLRDVHLTVVSNQMNRSMQQLAAWGAMLIVATLITGVLGMNFRDAPNVSWHIGFLAVLAVIALFTLPMYAVFRKQRWL
jgi:magnesium transporter